MARNKVMSDEEDLLAVADLLEVVCSSCKKNGRISISPGSHTCPFAEEINDSHELCDCCENCTHECVMGI